jgi:hypothetical protein
VKVEKLKCSFCDSENDVQLLATPVDVVVDSNGSIKWVAEQFNLPACFDCRCMLGFGPRIYHWIEEVLRTPFSDGRKRITDLILVPYLTNVRKLSYDKVEEIIESWFRLCNYSRREYGKQLSYQFRYAIMRNLAPMSKARFEAELKQFESGKNG